jgi:hypothetical protein
MYALFDQLFPRQQELHADLEVAVLDRVTESVDLGPYALRVGHCRIDVPLWARRVHFGTGGHSRARARSRDTVWNVRKTLDRDHSIEMQTGSLRCPRWREVDLPNGSAGLERATHSRTDLDARLLDDAADVLCA